MIDSEINRIDGLRIEVDFAQSYSQRADFLNGQTKINLLINFVYLSRIYPQHNARDILKFYYIDTELAQSEIQSKNGPERPANLTRRCRHKPSFVVVTECAEQSSSTASANEYRVCVQHQFSLTFQEPFQGKKGNFK